MNAWGVTNSFPEYTPGQFPVHTPDKLVVKDIEKWRDYVHAPSLEFPPELWAAANGMYDAVDSEKAYKAVFVAPGLFEQCHHLCAIDNALLYFMTNPDEMHELIEFLTEWDLELAKGICENLHPDMVVHHSDSYAANLVPSMIKMGIIVWQGCMKSNNVPELIAKYGDKITFMGDIDNKDVDFTGWAPEDCEKAAYSSIERCGRATFPASFRAAPAPSIPAPTPVGGIPSGNTTLKNSASLRRSRKSSACRGRSCSDVCFWMIVLRDRLPDNCTLMCG